MYNFLSPAKEIHKHKSIMKAVKHKSKTQVYCIMIELIVLLRNWAIS